MATYMLSTYLEHGMATTLVERLMRYVPVQSIKIVIVAWQIVPQVRSGGVPANLEWGSFNYLLLYGV